MGFGDAKLAISIGWILGVSAGLGALVLSFWTGAVVGIILILAKHYGMKSEVPFAPFLVFAFLFLKFSNLFFANSIEFALVYAFYAVIFSLLIVVSVYDLRHKIIPDILSLTLGILSFASLFLITEGHLGWHIPGWNAFLAGPMLAFPFPCFYYTY